MRLRELVPDSAVPMARKVWLPIYSAVLYRKGRAKGRRFQTQRFERVYPGGGATNGNGTAADNGAASNGRPKGDLEVFFDNREEGPGIWKWRHYFEIYERHFSKFRTSKAPVRILEIGIYSGGSLDMWRDYFGDNCEIIGIDIEDDCRVYERENIEVRIGNQADRNFWSQFRETVGPVDIIVDDGGHLPLQQLVTLEEILDHLRPGGVYLCEDIYSDMNPFMAYLSGLMRSLHNFEIDVRDGGDLDSKGVIPNAFQELVHSIHLYPFAAVIETHSERIDNFISPRKGSQWQPWMSPGAEHDDANGNSQPS